MRTLALPIVLFFVASVGGLTLATQQVAAAFNYQPALGDGVFSAGHVRYYAPWAIVDWTKRWGDEYPRAFALGRLIALLGAVTGVFAAIAASRGTTLSRPFGADAWAKFEDVADAGLFAVQGTVLGRYKGELLAFDGPEHQLLVGASRSGKGRGHVVPTLLAWPASTLVLDVKGELDEGDGRHGFPGTSGYRALLGEVLRFAPTSASSNYFNPLFEVRKDENEVRDVQNIVEAIVSHSGETKGAEAFWNNSGKNLLTGVVLHVLYVETDARKSLAVVREKLRDLDRTCEEMRTTLHRCNPRTNVPEVHPEILHAASSYLAGEERLRSGVKATAESYFGVFADPLVAEKTSRSDFRLGDLMCAERPVTLFLKPPPSDAQRLMPLMRLVINQAARALMEDQERDAAGRPKRHKLLMVLDEFPQLGRLPFFETMMGAMAGYGIKAYLVCQSLNHITKAYGRDNVIVDNVHIITSFAAADPETAKRVSEMAGEAWEMRPQESEQRPRSLLGPRKGSVTYREERRSIILPAEVRSLPRDEQLIFVSGTRPIRAKKIRFDREPVFVQRLRPAVRAAGASAACRHDWQGVRALGRIAPEQRVRPSSTKSSRQTQTVAAAESAQSDLFVAPIKDERKISEIALEGLRGPPVASEDASPPAKSMGV
ncbi:MAG: type IV secretory system conjugative DNA transfer family protein [Hyphomonadaceae bacterium]|nr:type IV secretory system conjugative DNA transfer family protein [Hyphomonadaceae bacterium]